jgi:2,4-dienoyl-CoA reductase-like NADH-dependent reductase (Old Yellow Enzyme family)
MAIGGCIVIEQYTHLFSPGIIGPFKTINRFVSQPMEGNDSDHGAVSADVLERYRQLAAGRWGIIIVEALTVDAAALARKDQLVINSNNVPGLTKLIDAIKAIAPDTLVIFQITHSGRKSGKAFSRPTALYAPTPDEHLLTTDEIQEIQDKFVEAARLSELAGADGIDFKMCHGYLGGEILRPANIRDDRWGGSFENRTRFFREGFARIRENQQRADFILGSRISYYEGIRGGCGTVAADDVVEDLSEMDEVIRIMAHMKLDYLNVTAGIPGVTSEIGRPTATSRWLYLQQFRYARRAKSLAQDMKIFGSAYTVLLEESIKAAEENLARGDADFVGWGRQSLADPHFPAKIDQGLAVDYCKLCSGCSKHMVRQEKVRCIFRT